MSNPILEGMARASLRIKTQEGFDRSTEHTKVGEIVGMRDALLWLADNVSTEMLKASLAAQTRVLNEGCTSSQTIHLECLKAALRQAASTEEK